MEESWNHQFWSLHRYLQNNNNGWNHDDPVNRHRSHAMRRRAHFSHQYHGGRSLFNKLRDLSPSFLLESKYNTSVEDRSNIFKNEAINDSTQGVGPLEAPSSQSLRSKKLGPGEAAPTRQRFYLLSLFSPFNPPREIHTVIIYTR